MVSLERPVAADHTLGNGSLISDKPGFSTAAVSRGPLHFPEDFAFLTAFFGFSSVASTVREISSSVTPLDTAFRTAFLMRFTAFFFFAFASAIDSPSQIAINMMLNVTYLPTIKPFKLNSRTGKPSGFFK